MTQQAEPRDMLLEFKRWAAQAHMRCNGVYRWYQKLIKAEHVVEMGTWEDMPLEMRRYYKAHKVELKELGIAVANDNGTFMLFADADKAYQWRFVDKVCDP